jgi:hypothetical protein
MKGYSGGRGGVSPLRSFISTSNLGYGRDGVVERFDQQAFTLRAFFIAASEEAS